MDGGGGGGAGGAVGVVPPVGFDNSRRLSSGALPIPPSRSTLAVPTVVTLPKKSHSETLCPTVVVASTPTSLLDSWDDDSEADKVSLLPGSTFSTVKMPSSSSSSSSLLVPPKQNATTYDPVSNDSSRQNYLKAALLAGTRVSRPEVELTVADRARLHLGSPGVKADDNFVSDNWD